MTKRFFQSLVTLLAVALMVFSVTLAQDSSTPKQSPVPPDMEIDRMLAQAQPDMPPDSFEPPLPPFGGRGHRGMWGDQKSLEQFRMLKLLEFLDIQADQETEFITLFSSMRRQQRDYDHQRRDLLDSLAVRLESDSSDDNEILKLADSVIWLQDQRMETMKDFMGKVRKMLTPRQLGRAVIFQERFELQLLEKLEGFRNRGGMQRGMPPDSSWEPDNGRPGKNR